MSTEVSKKSSSGPIILVGMPYQLLGYWGVQVFNVARAQKNRQLNISVI